MKEKENNKINEFFFVSIYFMVVFYAILYYFTSIKDLFFWIFFTALILAFSILFDLYTNSKKVRNFFNLRYFLIILIPIQIFAKFFIFDFLNIDYNPRLTYLLKLFISFIITLLIYFRTIGLSKGVENE